MASANWQATAKLTQKIERTRSGLQSLTGRWAGRESYRTALMQARNNIVKEVNSMEESFGSMIATSAKGVAGGQTCKSILMLREIARQFGTLQRANLALKQSLESGASSNKDGATSSYCYLRARRMQCSKLSTPVKRKLLGSRH